jgi:hypothetical protein
MNEHHFIPNNESDLLNWLKNFSETLPGTGISLGITPAEISTLNSLVLSVIENIQNGKIKEKQLEKNAAVYFISLIVQKMKKHPSYDIHHHGRILKID